MSAGNYRWVLTDRRTDREILNEIAAGDTPIVIVSRKDPTSVAEIEAILPSIQQADAAMVLLEPSSPAADESLKVTRGWPVGLGLLVTPPEAFAAVVISRLSPSRKAAAEAAQSLWDGLLQLSHDGATSLRHSPDNGTQILAMGTPVRRRLTPIPSHRISQVRREEIDRLAGSRFPACGPDTVALKAGLWLWHDALDESHACSQSIEGQGKHRAGDYWHAILHRREPDYGNSKYWFRHVGQHPVFAELGEQAAPLIAAAAPEWLERLLRGGWNSLAFVDFCEAAAAQNHSPHISLAESIQELEMLLLLASTYVDASAG